MKWGARYGSEYVNRLYAATRQHTGRPTRMVCFTDDTSGIVAEVEIQPIPKVTLPKGMENYPWRKLAVWKYPLADLEGNVLFLDLDLVITGNLDAMFDYEPGRFCVIENWTQRGQGVGNTSVYRFPTGKFSHIYDNFEKKPDAVLSKYRNEQVYISREIEDMVFWPRDWCASFKHDLLPPWPVNFFKPPALPCETRIVAFTGKPDQDEALRGEWPVKHWIKKTYKHVRSTPWIGEHWR